MSNNELGTKLGYKHSKIAGKEAADKIKEQYLTSGLHLEVVDSSAISDSLLYINTVIKIIDIEYKDCEYFNWSDKEYGEMCSDDIELVEHTLTIKGHVDLQAPASIEKDISNILTFLEELGVSYDRLKKIKAFRLIDKVLSYPLTVYSLAKEYDELYRTRELMIEIDVILSSKHINNSYSEFEKAIAAADGLIDPLIILKSLKQALSKDVNLDDYYKYLQKTARQSICDGNNPTLMLEKELERVGWKEYVNEIAKDGTAIQFNQKAEEHKLLVQSRVAEKVIKRHGIFDKAKSALSLFPHVGLTIWAGDLVYDVGHSMLVDCEIIEKVSLKEQMNNAYKMLSKDYMDQTKNMRLMRFIKRIDNASMSKRELLSYATPLACIVDTYDKEMERQGLLTTKTIMVGNFPLTINDLRIPEEAKQTLDELEAYIGYMKIRADVGLLYDDEESWANDAYNIVEMASSTEVRSLMRGHLTKEENDAIDTYTGNHLTHQVALLPQAMEQLQKATDTILGDSIANRESEELAFLGQQVTGNQSLIDGQGIMEQAFYNKLLTGEQKAVEDESALQEEHYEKLLGQEQAYRDEVESLKQTQEDKGIERDELALEEDEKKNEEKAFHWGELQTQMAETTIDMVREMGNKAACLLTDSIFGDLEDSGQAVGDMFKNFLGSTIQSLVLMTLQYGLTALTNKLGVPAVNSGAGSVDGLTTSLEALTSARQTNNALPGAFAYMHHGGLLGQSETLSSLSPDDHTIHDSAVSEVGAPTLNEGGTQGRTATNRIRYHIRAMDPDSARNAVEGRLIPALQHSGQ